MLENGVAGTGLSARKRQDDLSDFAAELDLIEALGVESIELPIFDLDVIVGGKIRRPRLEEIKRACAGRSVAFSVHGPLAINFMDEARRLPRHLDVLSASLEVAAELGAKHYVVHSGLARHQSGDGLKAAYHRQREWLARGGDIARQNGLYLCVETMFGGYDGSVHASSPQRLADELAAIAHPNVAATIDFSHAYINLDFAGARQNFVAEIKALAPYGRHLHVHDSFGRQDDIWMFTIGERLAYGHGDLHLPVGWGDLPWEEILAECTFPEGVVFNIELQQRYWYAAQEAVDATKALAARARTTARAAAA
ncbi:MULTISPECIES: sugar phosphate isomerase/epimerase family protein [Nitratireductor]|uniref:sugar phosphate isomerase/epimerase family protein n=1 Tax=Nitratireductor TaxID=245876 RepID=UPI000D0D2017|nr:MULTISPECIES: sugar phosphate isomerase/epimerase [Nitratireductor]PSM16737.1 xylose isomerase [Nitratireductor sp. StC3]